MPTWYYVNKSVPGVIQVQATAVADDRICLLYQTLPQHTHPRLGAGYGYFPTRDVAEQQLNTWRTDEHFRPV